MKAIARSVRLYFREAWFSYRALFAWQKLGPYLSVKVFFPLFTMLLFIFMDRYSGSDHAAYILIGNLLLLPATNAVSGVSMTIGNERNFGTLSYLIGSPAPRLPLYLGRTFFHILDGWLSTLIALPITLLVFRVDFSGANLWLTAGCVLLLSLAPCGLGMVLGSISLLYRDGYTITSILSMAFYFLCGVNFSTELLPPAFQTIAYGMPLTRGILAARLALAGATWPDISVLVGQEALVGLIYALVGYGLFLLIERLSLKNGQLDSV